MSNPSMFDRIDRMTLGVDHIKSRLQDLAVDESADLSDVKDGLDELVVLHAALREELRLLQPSPDSVKAKESSIAVTDSEPPSQLAPSERLRELAAEHDTQPSPSPGHAELDALAKQVDRIDAQVRRFNELNSQRLRSLETEIRTRLGAMERRHEDLLNGRIFATLRRVRRMASSTIGAFSLRGVASPPVAAVPVQAETAPVEDVLSLVGATPAALPPVKSVRIVGVPYMSRPEGGVSAASVTYSGTPLISVVMTCFNTAEYVRAAAESILAQTWGNLELIAVDDCSTDSTRDILLELASRDDRVKVYCFGENRGTYWCKNFGITKSSGAVITFMDSDDISLPERIEAQFLALNQVGRVVSTCNHVRKTPDGKAIAINGIYERVAYISQMVKRQVFDEVGFFDTVRTSADDEFLRRIRITYGRETEVNVKKPLYVALLRDGSLTSDPENAINFVQDRSEGQAFLSPQRRHYAAMCDRWHGFLLGKKLRPYVPFPVVRRPFPVFGKLVVAGTKYEGNYVSACMASYPPREEKLRAVITSLLPQVDRIYVYLNEYAEVPDFLRHSRITVHVGGSAGNIRDNGKFHFMDKVPDGYVFTVDDDIDYPSDYVQTLIRKIEFYDRGAIVGVHGTVYAKPVRSFFKGRTLLHFEEELSRDTIVNQLGTGTVAFHTTLVRPVPQWFKDTGMADVWFAVETKKRNITHIAIERKALWLTPLGVEETTLFREFRKNDSLQTQAVRSVAPWKEILRPPLNTILPARRTNFGAAYEQLLPNLGIKQSAQ